MHTRIGAGHMVSRWVLLVASSTGPSARKIRTRHSAERWLFRHHIEIDIDSDFFPTERRTCPMLRHQNVPHESWRDAMPCAPGWLSFEEPTFRTCTTPLRREEYLQLKGNVRYLVQSCNFHLPCRNPAVRNGTTSAAANSPQLRGTLIASRARRLRESWTTASGMSRQFRPDEVLSFQVASEVACSTGAATSKTKRMNDTGVNILNKSVSRSPE
ncbi:hypothetical protein BKA93DRAFT_620161 [Sparassis latifolia]